MQSFLVGECGYALYRIASDGALVPAAARGHGGYTVAVPVRKSESRSTGATPDMVDPDSILPNTRWKITIDKLAFDKLKNEESFWCIVALSRVVNALRFVHSPLAHYQDDSPGAARVRYNSFLFNCALFYEASLFVQKLHKHHGQLPEFQEMVSVLNTKEARDLLQSNLAPIRNRLVFHFGIDEIGEQLRKLELDDPIYVSAMGTTNEQAYHELADLCALSTFSGSAFPNTDAGLEILKQLLQKTTDLTLQFLEKAELFIVAVLQNGGWELVAIPESAGGPVQEE
jgi:hypothetical protein